jgi:CBS domain containing-hemolysin-like protein
VITHPRGYEFEVTDADPRRIKHVRIRKIQRPAVDAASPKPADEV